MQVVYTTCVVCVYVSVSIYSTDALLSSLSVKSEKRDKREKSDHDRKKSYFEKPAEVCIARFNNYYFYTR